MARLQAGPEPPTHFPQIPLVVALKLPRVLSLLTAHLDWPDLLSLLNTCSHCRNVFLQPDLRDTILSRFVPTYANALLFRDTTNYHDLPVSLHDLDLLLISDRFPLHRYPTHALHVLTASYPTLEESYITTKLISLSQAHTRFVLLLQALVHSSSSPVPPERDDFRRKSHRLSAPASLSNSGPLEFPAPLSYLKERAAYDDPAFDSTSVSKHLKRHSKGKADVNAVGLITINSSVPEPRLSRQGSKLKSSRSLFRKARATLPLPERDPHALRIYSTYRRNSAYDNKRLSRATSANDFAPLSASLELKVPERHLVPSTDSSTSSSPMASSSPLPQPRGGERSIIGHTSPSSSSSHSSISTASPHDLHLATSRTRAPVLRVFVPCTKMEVDSESVLLCERQLVEAGLWQHLSIGDIVCNFGYIPPTSEDTSTVTEEDSATPQRWSPRSRCGNSTGNDSRKWLLFDGDTLVPYIASNVLPVENPISLPSPYYYAHLMPNVTPFSNVSHFRFMIGKFPPVKHEIPQLTMVNLASRVRSRKSVNGWVEVRRWVWTARFARYRPTLLMDPTEEIGAGWLGEWVLEGMGTSEGRQMLLDILNHGTVPGGPREWELVRERSGGGKIWLRLIA